MTSRDPPGTPQPGLAPFAHEAGDNPANFNAALQHLFGREQVQAQQYQEQQAQMLALQQQLTELGRSISRLAPPLFPPMQPSPASAHLFPDPVHVPREKAKVPLPLASTLSRRRKEPSASLKAYVSGAENQVMLPTSALYQKTRAPRGGIHDLVRV